MSNFKYIKKQDRYFITNTSLVTIEYTLQKLYEGVDYLVISDGYIPPGETKEIRLTEDGDYKICIDSVTRVYIKHYLSLKTSIIEGISGVLCNCDCGCDCNEEDNKCCDLLMLRAKFDLYKRLIKPESDIFYEVTSEYIKSLIDAPIYCNINKEVIQGVSNCDEKLTKQMLGLDYIDLYFSELVQTCLTEDKEYLNNKFKTKSFFCCLEKLDINLEKIKETYKKMGLFTINNSGYINLPPSQVGNFTLDTANRFEVVFNLSMFTTGTTPVYADPEGDSPKEVRIDTLPLLGFLELNGVNVTVGQIIPVVQITSGNLKFISPDQNAASTTSFTFSVSDTGSGNFTT